MRTEEQVLIAMFEALIPWYEAHKRELPWRQDKEPYHVWLSEIMLQQTRVEAVKEYYRRFLTALPTIADLAEAPEEQILKLWEGLGYYNRVRNLQKAAQTICADYTGVFPSEYVQIRSLSGIGDYTASAVLSFAFGERIAVVDTNIRRVLSRAFVGVESLGGSASPAERALAKRLLPDDDSAKCRRFDRPSVVWNQAVMELGATVCTAKSPLCEACPIAGKCAFLRNGRPGLGQRRTRPRQRFQGTDRQVRGLVLNALRGLPDGETVLDRKSVERLWKDHVQLDKCIASLDEDGLIEILPGGGVRLPV